MRGLVEGDGEGAAEFAGLAGEVEEAEGAEGVFWRDGEWGAAEDGVADVGVELAVVAGDGGVGGAGELGVLRELGGGGEGAPGGVGFRQPGLGAAEARRSVVGVDEGRLLGVDAEFAVAAVGAVDEEAR